MSDQTDLFSPADPANVITPENVLETLVGEGKKYKTPEELAKSRLHADIHIARLEQEAKDLREKVASAKTVDELIEAVKAKVTPENLPGSENVRDNVSAVPTLSAEQVAKLVADQITGHETSKQKNSNRAKAHNELVKMFGDKAQEMFAKEAPTPELRQALTQLAEVDPDKFVNLFKKEAPPAVVDSGASKTLGTLNFQASEGLQRGTQAYYSDLRRKNPKLYNSAAVQIEMHNAALSNPDKYFGRKI